MGTTAAAIEDNPCLHVDPNLCARLTNDPDDCDTLRGDAMAATTTLTALDRKVRQATGVSFVINTTVMICEPQTCNIVAASGTPIYRDYNHLSEA